MQDKYDLHHKQDNFLNFQGEWITQCCIQVVIVQKKP